MAVENTATWSGPFIANGVTVAFPFDFQTPSDSEVTVLLVDAAGNEMTAAPASYNVDLTDDGGTVTFDTAPVAGNNVFITLEPFFTQEIEFENGGRWLAGPVNEVNDRSAFRDLWLRDRISRAIRFPRGEVAPELPRAAQRAGKFLGFDGRGAPIVTAVPTGDVGPPGDTSQQIVRLVSDILVAAGSTNNQRWSAMGYHSVNDQGGGEFYWNAASTATHDGGSVINPVGNAGAGRWIRTLADKTVCPEMWGAIKHTTIIDNTDSTAAVQAMFNWLPTNYEYRSGYKVALYGRYGITNTIVYRAHHGIVMEGVNCWGHLSAGFYYIGPLTASEHLTRDLMVIEGCRRPQFRNFAISTRENATYRLRAGMRLSSLIDNGFNTQQEKIAFQSIRFGVYDGGEGQVGYKQFEYCVLGDDTAGGGNNDFHEFDLCKFANATWAVHNNTTQGVAWRFNKCLADSCDFGYFTRQSMYHTAPEFLLLNDWLFVGVEDSGAFVTIVVTDLGSERCYGGLLKVGSAADVTFLRGGADVCVNPADFDTINPAKNKLIETANNLDLNLKIDDLIVGMRGYVGSVAVGNNDALRRISLRNVDPNDFPIDVGTSRATRVFVETQPGHNPGSLTDYRQLISRQLLHPQDATPDGERDERDSRNLYDGNSFYGAVMRQRQIVLKASVTPGSSPYVFANFLPAGVILKGLSLLTVHDFPGTRIDIGDGSDADRWGSHGPGHDRDVRRVGTAACNYTQWADAAPPLIKANTNVVLTPVGGNFPGTLVVTLTAIVEDMVGKLYRGDGIDGTFPLTGLALSLGLGLGTAYAAGGGSGPAYLPATATSPSGGWAFARTNEAYAGQCVRLIRAGDAAQSDFGFLTNGAFDLAAARAWAGADGATLHTAYDQFGGTDHIPSSGNRPDVWLGAGGPYLVNRDSGTQGMPVPSSLTADRRNFAMFACARLPQAVIASGTFEMGSSQIKYAHSPTAQIVVDSSTVAPSVANVATAMVSNDSVVGVNSSASRLRIYRDGETQDHPAISSVTMSSGGVFMADASFAGHHDAKGFLFFPAALSDVDAEAVRGWLRDALDGASWTPTHCVTALGDSITQQDSQYDRQATSCVLDYLPNTVLMRNRGTNGDEASNHASDWSPGASRWIHPGAINILRFFIGRNDITNGDTSAQAITSVRTAITNARASGLFTYIIGGTPFPTAAIANLPPGSPVRGYFNELAAWIRTDPVDNNGVRCFDAIEDYNWDEVLGDAVTFDGAAANGMFSATYTSDGTHPNAYATELRMGPRMALSLAHLGVTVSGVSASIPVNTSAPALTGTAEQGLTLSAGPGAWSATPAGGAFSALPTRYRYQWQESANGTTGWSDKSGATRASYQAVSGDVGKYLRCAVTASNVAGSVTVNTVASAAVAAPSTSIGNVYLLNAGTTSFVVPAGATSISVEAIGCGGNGLSGASAARDGGGAGAAMGVTFAVTAGETFNCSIPAGGGEAALTFTAATGATRTMSVDYGRSASGSTRGNGGTTASNSQTGGTQLYTYAGGSGATCTGAGGGGGGGSAGPSGAGKTAGSAGAGGASGGAGSNGGSSTASANPGAASTDGGHGNSGTGGGACAVDTVSLAVAGTVGGGGGAGAATASSPYADGAPGGKQTVWTANPGGQTAGPGGGGGGGRQVAGAGGGWGGGGGGGITGAAGAPGGIAITVLA